LFFPVVRLELTHTPFSFDMEKLNSSLSIQTRQPQMEINSPSPKLEIDQTLPREEAGFRTMLSFARYTAELAREQVDSFTSKTVEIGNQLAEIQNPNSTIGKISAQELFTDPDEINYQGIPLTPPEIGADVQPLSVTVQPGELNINFQPASFQTNYIPGTISGQLVPQENRLDLKV